MEVGQLEGKASAFVLGAELNVFVKIVGLFSADYDVFAGTVVRVFDDRAHHPRRHGVNGLVRPTAPVDAFVTKGHFLLRLPPSAGIVEQTGDRVISRCLSLFVLLRDRQLQGVGDQGRQPGDGQVVLLDAGLRLVDLPLCGRDPARAVGVSGIVPDFIPGVLVLVLVAVLPQNGVLGTGRYGADRVIAGVGTGAHVRVGVEAQPDRRPGDGHAAQVIIALHMGGPDPARDVDAPVGDLNPVPEGLGGILAQDGVCGAQRGHVGRGVLGFIPGAGENEDG